MTYKEARQAQDSAKFAIKKVRVQIYRIMNDAISSCFKEYLQLENSILKQETINEMAEAVTDSMIDYAKTFNYSS